jgi:hypothetical protein
MGLAFLNHRHFHSVWLTRTDNGQVPGTALTGKESGGHSINLRLDIGANCRIDVRPDLEKRPCPRLRFTPATQQTIRAWCQSRTSSASVVSMRAGRIGKSSIPIMTPLSPNGMGIELFRCANNSKRVCAMSVAICMARACKERWRSAAKVAEVSQRMRRSRTARVDGADQQARISRSSGGRSACLCAGDKSTEP